MKLKRGDLVVVLVLAIAVISWFGISKLGEEKNERQIVIETNGNVLKKIPMEDGMKLQDIHINLENGKYIDLAVDENGVYVKDVICPDKLCQKTGLVSKVGQSIVCLPNKVVAYVEGKSESEVDDVSF